MIKNIRKPSHDQGNAEDFLAGDEADPTAAPVGVAAATLLARLLLGTALTTATRRRLIQEDGIAVLVEAPTSAWVIPLRRALNAIAAWDLVEVRDGTARHRRKPEEGAVDLADAIGRGQRVALVTHSPETHAPPAFIAAADLRLRPGRPTAALVAAAIRAVTGTRPRKVPDGVEGLDLLDLTSALRSGSGGAAACVRRLERAVVARSASTVRLRDVPPVHALHGYQDAGTWARRLVDDHRTMEPEAFWRQSEKAVVISGAPGVGKTSLCHSLAATMGLGLVETSVAQWFEGSSYLDRVLAAMVDAFASARSRAGGVVLLLDELDGMPSRVSTRADDRNGSYWGPLQAAYLREVEATAAEGVRVIVVGCTNFPGRLDPALLRPGRLGRLIHVGRPDAADLAGILRQHLGDDLDGADLETVAIAGAGGTGAEATAWVAAARRTARLAGRPMALADLMDAVAPPDDRPEADRLRCAIHESAHAVVGHFLGAGRLKRVSLLQSGSTGGSITTSFDGAMTHSKGRLTAMVVMALAGRAGEEAFGLGPSTGSHDDLEQATSIATSIRVSFGLGGTLLHRRPMDRAAELLDLDGDLRLQIEADLGKAYAAALACVRLHRSLVEALAHRLMARRVVDGAEFLRLVREHEQAMDDHAARPMEAGHG